MTNIQYIKTSEDLKNFLKEYFKDSDVEVYLFGSRARRDNSIFSDFDIGIVTHEDISTKLTLLKESLEKSNFPYKVDIVDLSLDERLYKIVLKEGIKWL